MQEDTQGEIGLVREKSIRKQKHIPFAFTQLQIKVLYVKILLSREIL
jgi:hypothetical protein